MIYFDNAATTYPKPFQVRNAAVMAITKYGGNPGRSGHKISMAVAEQVYNVRNLAANFFGAEAENVIFTLNCTHALNLAIKGFLQDGGHVIFSSLEHNSVSRPIYALSKKNVSYSIANVCVDDDDTINNFESLINPDTKAIICTVASNVTGQVLPYKRIGELCRKHSLCFIADGAQACGIIPLKMSDGFNFLCTAGHKGLYGTTGTGLLITDGKYQLSTIIEGGTGTTSDELEQTPILPEMLESGTLNTVGIISLGAGIKFINSYSMYKIFSHENHLCNMFLNGIKNLKGITVYRQNNARYVPIVSFNIHGLAAGEVSKMLNEMGFALRGGLHCAGIAHNYLGTINGGAVRFAPSTFNTEQEVMLIVNSLKKILVNLKN